MGAHLVAGRAAYENDNRRVRGNARDPRARDFTVFCGEAEKSILKQM